MEWATPERPTRCYFFGGFTLNFTDGRSDFETMRLCVFFNLRRSRAFRDTWDMTTRKRITITTPAAPKIKLSPCMLLFMRWLAPCKAARVILKVISAKGVRTRCCASGPARPP